MSAKTKAVKGFAQYADAFTDNVIQLEKGIECPEQLARAVQESRQRKPTAPKPAKSAADKPPFSSKKEVTNKTSPKAANFKTSAGGGGGGNRNPAEARKKPVQKNTRPKNGGGGEGVVGITGTPRSKENVPRRERFGRNENEQRQQPRDRLPLQQQQQDRSSENHLVFDSQQAPDVKEDRTSRFAAGRGRGYRSRGARGEGRAAARLDRHSGMIKSSVKADSVHHGRSDVDWKDEVGGEVDALATDSMPPAAAAEQQFSQTHRQGGGYRGERGRPRRGRGARSGGRANQPRQTESNQEAAPIEDRFDYYESDPEDAPPVNEDRRTDEQYGSRPPQREFRGRGGQRRGAPNNNSRRGRDGARGRSGPTTGRNPEKKFAFGDTDFPSLKDVYQ